MENETGVAGTDGCGSDPKQALRVYVGVKHVLACGMTRGSYNVYRGWIIPENENPVDEGYLVVYLDGYESWCPKKQFEETNLLFPTGVPLDTFDSVESLTRMVREGEHTTVLCTDGPGPGGACHSYRVEEAFRDRPCRILLPVEFQYGPISENGVNGVQMEDLLAICIDRLLGFQSGDYPCHENAMALMACRAALGWLDKRTADRKARNVEGQSKQ